MSLFDRMKKGIEGAVEKGAKLSKDAIDKTEKASRLRRLRGQRTDVLREAGAFAIHADELQHERLAAFRAQVAELNAEIAGLEQEMEAVKESARQSLEGAREKAASVIRGDEDGEGAADDATCVCGAALEPGQKFCGECGRPVAAHGPGPDENA